MVNVAHNTTIELTCTDTAGFLPSWFMNGSVVFGDRFRTSRDDTGAVTGTLTINGNDTCGTLNVYCNCLRHNRQALHNTSLRVEG